MSRISAPLACAILGIGLSGACNREPAAPPPQPAAQPAGQPAPASPAASPAAPPPPSAAAQSAPPPAGNAPAETPSAQQPAAPPAAAPAAPPPAVSGPSASSPATPPAAAPETAAIPRPEAPPEPRYREVTIPEGTVLHVSLRTPVASDTSAVEDPVTADLRSALVVDGRTVLPTGTDLHGNVTNVARSAKVKGRAQLSLRFSSLVLHGERLDIRTASIAREAESTKKKDTAKIGIPAAGGALLGGIIGGKKGAAIGAGVGGGAGTAAVLTTRGDEVRLATGTPLSVRLTEPLSVRIRVD